LPFGFETRWNEYLFSMYLIIPAGPSGSLSL
jgi:hypothetical protein